MSSGRGWRFFLIGEPAAGEAVSPRMRELPTSSTKVQKGRTLEKKPRLPQETEREKQKTRDEWARRLPKLVRALCRR